MIERALCPVLIGRDAELGELEDALLAALRGDGGVVVVGGEAGLGKTRLVRELGSVARRAGAEVLHGSCTEADLVLPYLPFLEAIGNHLADGDLDSIREALGPAGRDLGRLFPALDPEGRSDQAEVDPVQAKLRLFEAIVALLDQLGRDRGLLLVVEDVHWADPSTRELLDYLPRRLGRSRVLLVLTLRVDELNRRHPLAPIVSGWRRSGVVRDVVLRPLGADRVAAMVRAIFDSTEVSPEFRDLLHDRSDGNPFVLEELLKSAMDRGDIYRDGGEWQRRELAELSLPTTVRESVLGRLEHLGADEHAVVDAAAVLGQTFAFRALATVSGRDEEAVGRALQTLVLEQLMEEDPESSEFRFRHALTREAVYDDLLAPTRQALHGRAADALRGLEGSPTVDVARHLIAAGRWADAVPACLAAAEEAEQRQAFADAIELYERILPHVPDPERRGDLLLRFGLAIHQTGDPARAQPLIEEAVSLLEGVGDARSAGRARLRLGRVYWERSQPGLARVEYERGRELLEPFGPSAELAVAYARLASLHAFDYEGPQGSSLARRAIEIAEAAGADDIRIWAYNFLGISRWFEGDEADGLAWLDRSYREAAELGIVWAAGNALYNEVESRCESFTARAALPRIELLRPAYSMGTRRGQSALIGEGLAMLKLGAIESSIRADRAALAMAEEGGSSTYGGWVRGWLAQALAAADVAGEARRLVPDRPTSPERQVIVTDTVALLWVLIDSADVSGAVAATGPAFDMLDWPRPLWHEALRAIELAVEANLLGGRLEDAARLVAGMIGAGPGPDGPYTLRARGRLALAEGRWTDSRLDLQAAVDFLAGVGYRLEEWRTRRALAEALLGSGVREAAVTELRVVVEGADLVGASYEARRAREALAALGVEIPASATAAAPERAPSGPEAPMSVGTAADDASITDVGRPAERLVTVLFADVRGFTRLAGGAAPADVATRIADFQRWARDEVSRRDGLVDKFAGDAVMATFNVTTTHLDHTVRAFEAARAIRDKATLGGFEVGVGLAVGPAIVGQLTDGANISAIGGTTNLAARLQAAAGPGEILVDGEAFARLRDHLRDRGLRATEVDLELKGFVEPVRAYRVGR
jgi:class 3 adenylate cyclase/tetratricopeptide (TPR) repeat protein